MKVVFNLNLTDNHTSSEHFVSIDPFENNAIYGNTSQFAATPGLQIIAVSPNILIRENDNNSGIYSIIFIGTGEAHFSLTDGNYLQKLEGYIKRRQVWIGFEPGSTNNIEYGDKEPGYKLKCTNMAFGESPDIFLNHDISVTCDYNTSNPSMRASGVYHYFLNYGPNSGSHPNYTITLDLLNILSFKVEKKSLILNIKTFQSYGHKVYENMLDYESEIDELEFIRGNFVYDDKLNDLGKFHPLWVEGIGNSFKGKINSGTVLPISTQTQEYWIFLDNYFGNHSNYAIHLNWLLVIAPRLLIVEVANGELSNIEGGLPHKINYLGFIDGEDETNSSGFKAPIFFTFYNSENTIFGIFKWILQEEGKADNYVFSYEDTIFNVKTADSI